MSDVKIFGVARSSYVRSARWAFEEKGVPYTLVPPDGGSLTSAEYLTRHPFGKIPALSHGDVNLYEVAAIAQYADEAFDGPALQPADPAGRALMRQWIGVSASYLDPDLLRGYIFTYAFAEGEVDDAKIKAAVPHIEHHTQVLDDALKGRDFLAGDALSIADIIIAPIINATGAFKEGKEILAERPNLTRALEAWISRPAYAAASLDSAKAA